MTLLLASVTGPEEAALALAHGADIIDLKDASNGALGALAPEVVRASVTAVGGRRPVSAVTGDLADGAGGDRCRGRGRRPQQGRLRQGRIVSGAEAAGLHPRAVASSAQETKIVGVMFADRGADNALLQLMAESGFAGAMLDTAEKQRRPAARLHGRRVPGALRRRLPGRAACWRVSPARSSRPTFRGCCCWRRTISASAARFASDATVPRASIPRRSRSFARSFPSIPAAPPTTTPPSTRGRLPAAGGAGDIRSSRTAVTPRPTAFSCAISCCPPASAPMRASARSRRTSASMSTSRCAGRGHGVEDMRDVFSYDVITDGIRIIVAQEHIAFLETLAERVAASVLGHPRVVSVTVARREARRRTGRGRRRDRARAAGRRRQGASSLSCRGPAAESRRVNARRGCADGRQAGRKLRLLRAV